MAAGADLNAKDDVGAPYNGVQTVSEVVHEAHKGAKGRKGRFVHECSSHSPPTAQFLSPPPLDIQRGYTALIMASDNGQWSGNGNGHDEVAKLLVAAGADVNAANVRRVGVVRGGGAGSGPL